MRIGVDIDGVLADFVTPYMERIYRKTGLRLPDLSATYPNEWDFDRTALTKEFGVEQAQRILREIWEEIKEDDFWTILLPLPEGPRAIERLSVLAQTGESVYFITSRPGAKSKWRTEWWLKLAGMYNPTVLIANSAEDKGLAARALHLDAFVEDKPENAMAVRQARPKTRVYLVNQPWNQWADQPKNYGERVSSILQALDIEDAIANAKELKAA